jgi:hypothetical protein
MSTSLEAWPYVRGTRPSQIAMLRAGRSKAMDRSIKLKSADMDTYFDLLIVIPFVLSFGLHCVEDKDQLVADLRSVETHAALIP